MTHFYTYESHILACVTVSGIVRPAALSIAMCTLSQNRFVCAVKSRNTQSENTCIPSCMGVHICWNSQLETLRYIVRRIRRIVESENWRHVCPSVRTEHLGCRWTDFCEISYLSMFRKSVEKIQVSLKPDKNNGYSTCSRPIYIYDHISLIFS
jgi:hypothetical protein